MQVRSHNGQSAQSGQTRMQHGAAAVPPCFTLRLCTTMPRRTPFMCSESQKAGVVAVVGGTSATASATSDRTA
eukprot:14043016-Alexandrium_andersonii.AAC.1